MALLGLAGLGLLMIVLVAVAPWILRIWDYALFVPAIALSGIVTIAATTLAPSVPERSGLILIIAMIPYMLLGLGVMAWLALRASWRTNATLQETLSDIGALLMAGLFFLSPNYPWYVLAVVPFIVLGGGTPAWAMTLGAIQLYKPVMLPENDLVWKTIATLPFVIAAAAHLLPGASIAACLRNANPIRARGD